MGGLLYYYYCLYLRILQFLKLKNVYKKIKNKKPQLLLWTKMG